MKTTKIKKILSAFLATAVLLSSSAFQIVMADSENYAMIEFGEGEMPTLTNITKWRSSGDIERLYPTNVGGEWGHSTDRNDHFGNGVSRGILLDISDSFMYDLSNQKVKITIKYWDGEHPTIESDFDPANDDTYARIRAMYDGTSGTQTLTEDICVRNRNKWNTATIILDDFKASNRLWDLWDMEITDIYGSKNISRDVVYQSIKIEPYVEANNTPLELTGRINLGNTGNFVSVADTQITVNIPVRNTSNRAISANWHFDILDENNREVESYNYLSEISANETKTINATFKNPKVCGVYTLKTSADVTITDTSKGDTVVETRDYGTENFSISYINAQGQGNDKLGINMHSIGGGYGEASVLADAIVKAGYGWVREANVISTTEVNNHWTMSNKAISDLGYIDGKGLKVLMQLWGPLWNWKNGTEGGCIPLNSGDREQFANWCTDITEQTKDYVDAYEIFNEPNASMFPNTSTYTNYTTRGSLYKDALEEAYYAITDVDDSKKVVAMATSGAGSGESLFKAGAYKAKAYNFIDIYSTHRYPYHDHTSSEKQLLVSDKESEVSLVKSYNSNKNPYEQMWLTEFGINTVDKTLDGSSNGGNAAPWGETYWNTTNNLGYEKTVPRRTQARGFTLAYGITSAYSAFDKMFIHTIVDYGDLTQNEHTWGILNSYKGAEGYTPYSAKPSFVSTAAFNHFVDDTSTSRKTLEDSDRYALWFGNSGNSKMDKDVILLQSELEATTGYETLNVGATSVDVYDLYGNKLGTMKSSSGQYTFRINNEPYYLVGDFTQLTKVNNTASVSINTDTFTNCAVGTAKSFTLSGVAESDQVTVDGLDVISVTGTTTKTVTVKVPQVFSGRAYGQVKVTDSNGNLKFVTPIELRMADPGLFITSSQNTLNIRGMASQGGDTISAMVTDSEGSIIALDQKRARESGTMLFELDVEDIKEKSGDLRIYNGSTTLNQTYLPDFEMYYTCKKNNKTIPLSALDVSDLKNGDTLDITLNLANNGSGANPSLVFCGAVYDADGKLVNAYRDGNLTWSENKGTLTLSIPVTDASSVNKMKFYVWKTNNEPLKKAVKIN